MPTIVLGLHARATRGFDTWKQGQEQILRVEDIFCAL